MELGKLKDSLFYVLGVISVTAGILGLILINIAILTGINIIMGGYIFNLMSITFMLAIITVFPKSSQSFGTRGLFLGIYLIVFMGVTFILGWRIYPFP